MKQLTKLCDFIRERGDIVVIRSTVCSQRSAADVGWLKANSALFLGGCQPSTQS